MGGSFDAGHHLQVRLNGARIDSQGQCWRRNILARPSSVDGVHVAGTVKVTSSCQDNVTGRSRVWWDSPLKMLLRSFSEAFFHSGQYHGNKKANDNILFAV